MGEASLAWGGEGPKAKSPSNPTGLWDHAFLLDKTPGKRVPGGGSTAEICELGAGWQGGTVQECKALPGREGGCPSKALRADPARARKFITSLDSAFQSLQRLAGKFMRTGLFSGVLALSLHVLIGTREAVSANVFVP